MRLGRGWVRQALFSLVRHLEFLWKVSECCWHTVRTGEWQEKAQFSWPLVCGMEPGRRGEDEGRGPLPPPGSRDSEAGGQGEVQKRIPGFFLLGNLIIFWRFWCVVSEPPLRWRKQCIISGYLGIFRAWQLSAHLLLMRCHFLQYRIIYFRPLTWMITSHCPVFLNTMVRNYSYTRLSFCLFLEYGYTGLFQGQPFCWDSRFYLCFKLDYKKMSSWAFLLGTNLEHNFGMMIAGFIRCHTV